MSCIIDSPSLFRSSRRHNHPNSAHAANHVPIINRCSSVERGDVLKGFPDCAYDQPPITQRAEQMIFLHSAFGKVEPCGARPGSRLYYFLEPSVAQPPFPLQEFLPLHPLSLVLQPPLPLQEFLPSQPCFSFSAFTVVESWPA